MFKRFFFCFSAASSLIRGMLTVNAEERATILDICSHWWVNEGYARNCLEEAEYLASLTPVRLDLLLSLTRQEKREPPEEIKSEVSRGVWKKGADFDLFGESICSLKKDSKAVQWREEDCISMRV